MNDLLLLLQETIPDVDFENTDRLLEQGLIDSMDVVEIIDCLEDKYNITINPDDIDPVNFDSLESIWSMLQKYIL